jgi:hypothetical protein
MCSCEHKLPNLKNVRSWPEVNALARPDVALAVLGLESGFETQDVAVIGEQDILGDRLVRPAQGVTPGGGISSPRQQASPPATSLCSRSRYRALCRVEDDRGGRCARTIASKSIIAGGDKLVPACRKYRTPVALTARRKPQVDLDRLGGSGLADAQSADEKSHPRDRA